MKKQNYFFALSIFAMSCCVLFPAISMAKDIGVWVKEKNFAQVNIGCTQTWTCHPKMDILHGVDTYVAVTRPKLIIGVCSASNGPIDSCNVCLSSPPKETCVWELKKK